MNKDEIKINKNDINNYFVNYLFEKHKDDPKKDKIKYYIILKEINKFLDIGKVKVNVKEFFINDNEEKDNLNILSEEQLKYCFETLIISILKKPFLKLII